MKVMVTCVHCGRPTSTSCQLCGRPVCDRCSSTRGPGQVVCTSCAGGRRAEDVTRPDGPRYHEGPRSMD